MRNLTIAHTSHFSYSSHLCREWDEMRSEKLSLGKFPEAEGGRLTPRCIGEPFGMKLRHTTQNCAVALRDYVGMSLRDVGYAQQHADYVAVPEKRAKGTSVHGDWGRHADYRFLISQLSRDALWVRSEKWGPVGAQYNAVYLRILRYNISPINQRFSIMSFGNEKLK